MQRSYILVFNNLFEWENSASEDQYVSFYLLVLIIYIPEPHYPWTVKIE